nr:terminase [Elusimicrobiota bacterium]
MEKIERKTTDIYDDNFFCKKRYVINKGGARSSKSHSVAQLYIQRFIEEENKRFLITRKTFPALRQTAYKLMVDLLDEYGIYKRINHHKTEHTLKRGRNYLLFASIDDPEKIKSTEWNYVWMEEANEFTYNDFMVIKTRLSGRSDASHPNQIHMSFNPVDEYCWINQKLILNPKYKSQLEVINSTYKDNPFLDKEYIKDLEGLKEEDEVYYQIYTLGKWATPKNIIYEPFIVDENYPEEFDEVIYGIDFGFNNPSVILEIGIKDGEYYVRELLYQNGLTNAQLIEQAKQLIPEKYLNNPVYADGSEPARVEEFFNQGFAGIEASDRRPGSVKDGIDFCKRQKIHTLSSNVNLNKERNSYKWREDRHGHLIDEPVKFNDHGVDAMRLAIYSHNKKMGAMPNIRWV